MADELQHAAYSKSKKLSFEEGSRISRVSRKGEGAG